MHPAAHAPLHGDHVCHEHAICHDVFVVPVDGLDVAHEALPVVRGDRLERWLPRGAAHDAEDFAAAALVRDGVRFGAGEVLVAFCVLEDAHLVLERLPLEWQRGRRQHRHRPNPVRPRRRPRSLRQDIMAERPLILAQISKYFEFFRAATAGRPYFEL